MYTRQEKRAFLLKWGSIYALCLLFSLGLGIILLPLMISGTLDYPLYRTGITIVLSVLIGYLVALKAWKNYTRANPK